MVHHGLALTYRTDTNRLLRRWTWFSRTALFAAVLLSDVAVILTMSWLTGVGYHLVVYGTTGDLVSFLEVGLLSAVLDNAPTYLVVFELAGGRLLLESSRRGVFAIGDVRSGSVKRVAAAVGEGAQVVADLHGVLAGTLPQAPVAVGAVAVDARRLRCGGHQ